MQLLSAPPAGLTTGSAPFVENAREQGELYIEQPYALYTPDNHDAWRRLYARMLPEWYKHANTFFLDGMHSLCLSPDRVPRLSEVNGFLCPLTGFQARAVSGYIPAFRFFDCLRRREFPTTITIRPADRLDYLPEPDIFHDIAGHVPMHTGKAFADTLVRFGQCAHTAAELVSGVEDEKVRIEKLTSIIRAMARFFWFTVEFGLMRGRGGELKAYGSGLLNSYGEIEHSLSSPEVERLPIELNRVIHQGFEIDHYQPLLFVIESFDHLFDLVGELERWMREGKLDSVAPGEPEVGAEDLKSFLHATR